MSEAEQEPIESDADLLSGALADEKPRDDKGRFAKPEEKVEERAEEEAPEPVTVEESKAEAKPDDDKRDAIPAWRLREEAEAKRAALDRADKLERELQQARQQNRQYQQHNQPKAEPIDPFENPQEWQKQQTETLEQRLLNERFNMSEMLARQAFGDEAVEAAVQWAQSLPSHEQLAIRNSLNPYGDLVKRKKQADTLAEIGTDPGAYKERLKTELMKDPEFRKAMLADTKQEAVARPESNVTRLPPSLNRQQSAANAKADAGDPNDTPMSDADLLADALRR